MRVQKYGLFTFPPKNPGTFFNIFLTKGADSGQKWPIEHCNPRVYSNIKIFILFSPQAGRLPSLYPDCTPRRRQSVGRNPIRTGLSPGATGLRPGKTGLRRVPAIIKRSKFITRPSSFISKGQGGQTFEKECAPGAPARKISRKLLKETGKHPLSGMLPRFVHFSFSFNYFNCLPSEKAFPIFSPILWYVLLNGSKVIGATFSTSTRPSASKPRSSTLTFTISPRKMQVSRL